MTKNKFTELLEKRIQVLNRAEQLRILCFYEETIDDCMEDGMSEEEAVASLGDMDEMINDILMEHNIALPKQEDSRTVRMNKPWQYVLLLVTSPIWLALTIAACLVILSCYLLIGCGFLLLALLFIIPYGICIASLIAISFQFFQNLAYSVFVLGILLLFAGIAIYVTADIKAWLIWMKEKTMQFTALIKEQATRCYRKLVF